MYGRNSSAACPLLEHLQETAWKTTKRRPQEKRVPLLLCNQSAACKCNHKRPEMPAGAKHAGNASGLSAYILKRCGPLLLIPGVATYSLHHLDPPFRGCHPQNAVCRYVQVTARRDTPILCNTHSRLLQRAPLPTSCPHCLALMVRRMLVI
jgi:hypothetical protein